MYFYDTGLVTYLTKHSTPEILLNSSINREILENYIISEVKKSYMNSEYDAPMFYYRDKEQHEIDLIIEYEGKLNPFEIKKTSNPTSDMIKNFNMLTKANLPTGTGGIICMKDDIGAIDSSNLIIPTWCI